ncbi:DEAD/DEAH box helicase family protein [Flavobacterium sp. LHD-80]|uniref:DEAD/DEAH box helicase n=1 Tax=Flavobacterium sp. LHD-80 TaxID=3071411 RepID=UPI0027E105A6|nr:DEAD/DEAH box helicase family protein [Flavobacterium sp. LHD-80]MDQ6471401.1 DEAD/DEAH box helicase family protein [Flavobacterium sp. LHD-80]
MELFDEIIEIDLLVVLKENDNNISYHLGTRKGVISKESDNGYSFIINDDEKFFFTFKHTYKPLNYNGIFYVDPKKSKGDIIQHIQNSKKECLEYTLPTTNSVVSSWTGNFDFKKEVLGTDKKPIVYGLRPPQIGALHSILAHWSISNDPAIIVMPTGTGKTETMLSLTIAHKCDKALVIVPSDSLRTQISKKFITLGILKEENFQIVSNSTLNPIVGTIKTSFKTKQDAENFYSKCNIIIATSSVLNKCNENGVGIFDAIISSSSLLIIDEAHHCEATTWDKIASKFIFQKKPVLKFTATPFRNDKKRLKGKTIYNYPLSLAQRDGSFMNINFVPIIEFNELKVDRVIAEKAIEQLRKDIELEYNHKMMARVEKIDRAIEVYNIYKNYTEFNPLLIHSRLSDVEKNEALDKIKNDDNCKIIVCVDMLGEGYDLPTLKICALHEIHKNITTSIQFFGRFTRSSSGKVGNATIIANIGDKNLKDNLLRKLYAKDADWNKILKISNEGILKNLNKEEEFFQKFDEEEIPYQIPLRNITPALSTVVYKVNAYNPEWKPDNHKKFFDKKNSHTVYAVHQEKDLLIIISKNNSSVRWGIIDDLINNIYDLHIIYFNRDQKLLFINSSNNGSLYEGLAKLVIGEDIYLINESDIYKSLHEVEQLELFNLGVKPISEEAISYTQLFGRNVGEALDDITKQTKSSANLFGKGFNQGERITIGCSSKGRVWSRMIKTIPEFCEWCDVIGKKLIDSSIDVKNIFNFIAKPERISEIPANKTPISIIWNDEIYYRETEFFINGISFYDYKINLKFGNPQKDRISFSIQNDLNKSEYELILSSNKDSRGYTYLKSSGLDLFFTYGTNENITIQEFFHKYPPIIRFSDSSKMYNDIYFEFKHDIKAFDSSRIETKNWSSFNTNLKKESQYNKTKSIKREDSIQFIMIQELKKDLDYKIIYDDDDKDEVSDIIALKYFEDDYSKLIVDLFHCKYSSENNSGSRLKDLYEVCGQAQRSFHWRHKLSNLIQHIKLRQNQRLNKGKPSRFEIGGMEELEIIKNIVESGFSQVIFNIHIVQPGVSKAKISDEQLKLLGATDMLLKNTGNNFKIIINN